MAETTINQFGKGIALNCGFDLGAKTLMDSRCLVKDETELNAIPDIRRANGLLVWVQDTKKLMAWDEPNSAFVEVTSSFDSSDLENRMTLFENSVLEHLSVKAENSDVTKLQTNVSQIEQQLDTLDVNDKFYSDKDYILASAHGGLKSGVNVKGMKIIDILKKILFPVTLPTLKVSACTTYEGILGVSDGYTVNVTSTGGSLAIEDQSIKIYYNGTALTDNSAEVEMWNAATTTIYATAETVQNETGDEDLDSISAVTVTSNKLTYKATPPLRVFTMDESGVDSMTNDLGVMYPNGISGADCYYAKSRKVNIPAFSNKRICIISPTNITAVYNPSGFDITSSFTLVRYDAATDKSKYAESWWSTEVKYAYLDGSYYFYYTDVNTQANAYPITIQCSAYSLPENGKSDATGGGIVNPWTQNR